MPAKIANNSRYRTAISRGLKEVREHLVTQTELEQRTGISQQLISRYESVTSDLEPSVSTIYALEDAMAVPHGSVLEAAGLIDDELLATLTVEKAIRLDPKLSDEMREVVLVTYRTAVRLSAAGQAR